MGRSRRGAGDGEELEMVRSWRWEGIGDGEELEMGSWRWGRVED